MSWRSRVVATELRKILAYRSDFWVNFLGQALMQFLIAQALWRSIFSVAGVQTMAGHNLEELTLYYLLAPISLKVLMGESIGFFSRDIYDGGLNRYLVWPLPPIGYKLLTYMTHATFYIAQMILIYSLAQFFLSSKLFGSEALLRLVLGGTYFVVAALGYFCLLCLCEMVAFWADNTWTLGVMLRFIVGFLGGSFIPLAFFPESFQKLLHYLPFSSMIAGPINLILGKSSWIDSLESFIILVLWMPIFYIAVRWLWDRGRYQYTGVGM